MSSPMVQLQEATIRAQCKQLRMPVMAAQFSSVAEQAVREKKSHLGYLEALLTAELEERERNTIARLPAVEGTPERPRVHIISSLQATFRLKFYILGA